MKVTKTDLPKSQVELTVELSQEEFSPYIERGAESVSKEVKIEGFRPGKVPFDVLKSKIGEMTILEEAARIAINKTIDQVLLENVVDREPVGQPKVDITKLAPENPLEYKVVIAVLPEIELDDYKGLKLKPHTHAPVSDKDVEKIIDDLRESRVREVVVDREIKEGDKVTADIEMFLDNIPVEGGQGRGAAAIIGKDYIIPGFDKNLLGAKKGDTREFKLHYPENHHMKNLAGKMVEFTVKINEVYSRELPETNDEFAKAFGLNSATELKENIKKSLEEEKKQHEAQHMEIELLDKLLEKTRFGELPEMLVDHETHAMLDELEHQVAHQGAKFDDYLASIKKTRDQLLMDLFPDAIKRVKSALLVREIAIKEKITVSEKEIDEKVEQLLKQYKGYQKVEERVKSPDYRNYLKNTIANRKVIEKLTEWNVEK